MKHIYSLIFIATIYAACKVTTVPAARIDSNKLLQTQKNTHNSENLKKFLSGLTASSLTQKDIKQLQTILNTKPAITSDDTTKILELINPLIEQAETLGACDLIGKILTELSKHGINVADALKKLETKKKALASQGGITGRINELNEASKSLEDVSGLTEDKIKQATEVLNASFTIPPNASEKDKKALKEAKENLTEKIEKSKKGLVFIQKLEEVEKEYQELNGRVTKEDFDKKEKESCGIAYKKLDANIKTLEEDELVKENNPLKKRVEGLRGGSNLIATILGLLKSNEAAVIAIRDAAIIMLSRVVANQGKNTPIDISQDKELEKPLNQLKYNGNKTAEGIRDFLNNKLSGLVNERETTTYEDATQALKNFDRAIKLVSSNASREFHASKSAEATGFTQYNNPSKHSFLYTQMNYRFDTDLSGTHSRIERILITLKDNNQKQSLDDRLKKEIFTHCWAQISRDNEISTQSIYSYKKKNGEEYDYSASLLPPSKPEEKQHTLALSRPEFICLVYVDKTNFPQDVEYVEAPEPTAASSLKELDIILEKASSNTNCTVTVTDKAKQPFTLALVLAPKASNWKWLTFAQKFKHYLKGKNSKESDNFLAITTPNGDIGNILNKKNSKNDVNAYFVGYSKEPKGNKFKFDISKLNKLVASGTMKTFVPYVFCYYEDKGGFIVVQKFKNDQDIVVSGPTKKKKKRARRGIEKSLKRIKTFGKSLFISNNPKNSTP